MFSGVKPQLTLFDEKISSKSKHRDLENRGGRSSACLANWRWMIWTRPGLAHRRLRGAEAEAAGASSPLHNPYSTNSPALRLPTPCAPPRALGDELLPRPSGRGAALRLPPRLPRTCPPRLRPASSLPPPAALKSPSPPMARAWVAGDPPEGERRGKVDGVVLIG